MRKLPRILVVEDEPAIAELIAVNLRHNGFQPIWVADGEAAQRELEGVLPDAILLDWMLPGHSGIVLARRWRADPRTQAVPILMVTARGDEREKVAGLDAGADDYITKPFSTQELLARIRSVLRRRAPEPVSETGPREIRTLSSAFNQMSADLKRLDEDRALLLAGVSHDLRTPLARIRLGLEMLGDKSDPSLMEGMVQDIADIDAVINQFLDFARISGEQSAATACNPDDIVNDVVERYKRQSVDVSARCGGLPPMPMKSLAIQRLLTNLIDNALRHGGPQVEIETSLHGTHARLSVFDRGPGIPAADAERMLQPFTRLNAARSTSGSGLGLAIVDRIAKMHHGSVQLLPRAGGGLEARVELPAG